MIVDIIGWIGTLLVLAAYYLINSEKTSPASRTYNLMNLVGALFIALNVYQNHAWPALGLQIVWGAVAVISLVKNIRKKPLQNKP